MLLTNLWVTLLQVIARHLHLPYCLHYICCLSDRDADRGRDATTHQARLLLRQPLELQIQRWSAG